MLVDADQDLGKNRDGTDDGDHQAVGDAKRRPDMNWCRRKKTFFLRH